MKPFGHNRAVCAALTTQTHSWRPPSIPPCPFPCSHSLCVLSLCGMAWQPQRAAVLSVRSGHLQRPPWKAAPQLRSPGTGGTRTRSFITG